MPPYVIKFHFTNFMEVVIRLQTARRQVPFKP